MARALLATEQAGLQLATLEDVMVELQRNIDLILEERNQALLAIEQLREEMDELKRLVEQLSAEKQQLGNKVGDL